MGKEVVIDIDDYLSESDKRTIAKDAFRDVCKQKSAKDFERILNNCAYDLVGKEVDAAFDGKMVDVVREKAIQVINNLSSHTVFSPPNAWDKEASKGWIHLQQAIDDAKHAIAERVLESIKTISADTLRERIEGLIGDVIIEKLTSTGGGK